MHRPERWGYVQFSTATPGQAVYRPDPAGPIRDRLMQVYHAQRAFFEQNKTWAASLDDLKLADAPGLARAHDELRLTPDGYEAAITFSPSGRETRDMDDPRRIRAFTTAFSRPGEFARLDIPVRAEIACGDRAPMALQQRPGLQDKAIGIGDARGEVRKPLGQPQAGQARSGHDADGQPGRCRAEVGGRGTPGRRPRSCAWPNFTWPRRTWTGLLPSSTGQAALLSA